MLEAAVLGLVNTISCWHMVLQLSAIELRFPTSVHENDRFVFAVTNSHRHCLAVWLSGNTISINEETVGWAGLILGLMTVCRQVHPLGM